MVNPVSKPGGSVRLTSSFVSMMAHKDFPILYIMSPFEVLVLPEVNNFTDNVKQTDKNGGNRDVETNKKRRFGVVQNEDLDSLVESAQASNN